MSEKRSIAEVMDGGPDSSMLETSTDLLALSRAEIDLQIATAKSYPRSLVQFQKSTMEMVTYSQEAAEKMYYKLPRKNKDGSTKIIEGPSVRLAEIIGQNWRNCRIGARVLGNDDKMVTSQGVFHDLETNVAISFEIRRRITRKDGTRYDDDMIGVTGAAAAGIAFRNAVLKGVPKMFWQPLYEKALETARPGDKEISARRKAAIAEFEKMGVPETALLKILGVTGISKIGADELVTLRGIFNAIREGTTTATEAFDLAPKPIQPSQEISSHEDFSKKLKESIDMVNAGKKGGKPPREKKKPKQEKAQTVSGPPKANIPPPVKVDTSALYAGGVPQINDPFLTVKEQTELYHVAAQSGWKVPEEVTAYLRKNYKGIQSIRELRQSQFAFLLNQLRSGT